MMLISVFVILEIHVITQQLIFQSIENERD